MTKRFLIILVMLFWCNVGFAESVYDFLEKDIERKFDQYLYLYAHNKHGSKQILLKRIEIWYTSCSNKSGDANRIYAINRRVSPYSDLEVLVSSNFTYKRELCYLLYAKFYEPPKYEPVKIKPEKKSGAKKLLEKIIGD